MENLIEEIKLIKGKQLQQKDNPWINIVKNINTKLNSNYSIGLIHEYYLKYNNDSYFYNSHLKNKFLEKILDNKKVIFVGPAPYLDNLKQGSFIDEYDIVIRMEGGASLGEKCTHGEKYDGVGSNLNLYNNYDEKLYNYLKKNKDNKNFPKFIITSDSTVGYNKFIYDMEKKYKTDFNLSVISLMKDYRYIDRYRLYWEILPKTYNEILNIGSIKWDANFSNGYGIINMLCGYNIRELFIIGCDFYNAGLDTINRKPGKMYSKAYQEYVGNNEGIYRKSDSNHDCLAQMKHLKYLLKRTNKKIILDNKLINILNDPDVIKRIETHSKVN